MLSRKATADAESSMPAAAVAATRASPGERTAADDARLLRPVDPSKPSYYWKPVQGEAVVMAEKEAIGPAAFAEHILGYQVGLWCANAFSYVDSSAKVHMALQPLLI